MSQSQSSLEPLRVLQLTDLHLFGAAGQRLAGVDTTETFRDCLALARRRHWPPDLVLLTGDLAHDPAPATYARLAALLEEVECPAYALPGNHDEGALLAAVSRDGAPLTARHLVRGAWQLVFLDSTVPGSDGGELGAAELAHLQHCLSAHGGLHTLVCLHHSPVVLDSDWMDRMRLTDAEDFFRILDAHPAGGGVLWGHVHQEYDARHGPWRLLATPSTCIQFAPGSEGFALDPRPPGYRWLRLHGDGRIDTGVERLPRLPAGFDPAAGY